MGSPIRKSPGNSVCATIRSLSQLTTSFIAFQCQGIHHKPLITLNCINVKPVKNHLM